MGLVLFFLVFLLVLILIALFYSPPAPYNRLAAIVGAVAALLLFLVAVGAWHVGG
jgi:uncharacterized membrane protein YqjE